MTMPARKAATVIRNNQTLVPVDEKQLPLIIQDKWHKMASCGRSRRIRARGTRWHLVGDRARYHLAPLLRRSAGRSGLQLAVMRHCVFCSGLAPCFKISLRELVVAVGLVGVQLH